MRDTRESFPYIDPPIQKVVNDGREYEYLEGTEANWRKAGWRHLLKIRKKGEDAELRRYV